jgi:hypothetical protein
MALTVMPWRPRSAAIARVGASSPALGGGIEHVIGARHLAGDRRDIDDPSIPATLHPLRRVHNA